MTRTIMRNTTRTVIAWTAIVALLLMALAPMAVTLLSRDASGRSANVWMDICSAFGDRPVVLTALAAAADDPAPGPLHRDAPAHCPYCVLHANAVIETPLATVTISASANALYQIQPPWFYQSPAAQLAWIIAPSRAPPEPLRVA